MNMKMFSVCVVFLITLLVLAFPGQADTITVNAVSGPTSPNLISFVGVIGGANGVSGFASFGFLDASGNYHFIDGYAVGLSINASEASVNVIGFEDGFIPVACTLTVQGVTPNATLVGVFQQGKVRLRTPDFDSGLGQNLYGWITESL